MATNMVALQTAIETLTDAVKDTKEAIAAGGNALEILFAYKNLIPDIIALAPQIGEIPAEGSHMVPADYLSLIEELSKNLGITDARTGTIIDVALVILSELVLTVLPNIENLVKLLEVKP